MDSVAFKRAKAQGALSVTIRLHPGCMLSIEAENVKAYQYLFISSCQRAVWEWLGFLDDRCGEPYIRAETPETQAVVWQRTNGMTCFITASNYPSLPDVPAVTVENDDAYDLL